MTVTIKTPAEQDKMRTAGRLAASVLDMIEPFVLPGATTEELDKRCHDFIVHELQSIPANVNYRGFPKTLCTSVNHVVCHGIPGDKRLKSGDIVNIDVTVIRDGFHGDTSRMYFVGSAAVLFGRRRRVGNKRKCGGGQQVQGVAHLRRPTRRHTVGYRQSDRGVHDRPDEGKQRRCTRSAEAWQDTGAPRDELMDIRGTSGAGGGFSYPNPRTPT